MSDVIARRGDEFAWQECEAPVKGEDRGGPPRTASWRGWLPSPKTAG